MTFIHEDSLARHLDYVNKSRLRLSILRKSLPMLDGKSVYDMMGMHLDADVAEECIPLAADVELHEVYFSSFSQKRFLSSPHIRSLFGSEAAFLNMLYREAMGLPYGFVSVGRNGKRVDVIACQRAEEHAYRRRILLAVDVCEHAYFSDFGFAKDEYLKEALSYLDLCAVDFALSGGKNRGND